MSDSRDCPGVTAPLRTNAVPLTQESPRQTEPKKGPKRKVHMNFAHFCVNSGVFFLRENKHDSHIELLFRNAPVKSS